MAFKALGGWGDEAVGRTVLAEKVMMSRTQGALARTSGKPAGFSLIELIIVIALVLIGLTVALLSLPAALASARVNSGAQTTLSQMRLAHQEAVSRRIEYSLTFTVPGTIVTQQLLAGQTPVTERTITLPPDVQFIVPPGGLPAAGPDGFGTGAVAIDFDQATGGGGNVIFFLPDGTAIDGAGNPNDGVIYVAHATNEAPAHAITMLGATCRFRVWNLTAGKGGPTWN